MNKVLKIGTRESELAVWQANLVKTELAKHGIAAELVFIKSEGDIDLVTPLYEIGVQGIFTKTLDAALLSNKIDIAVHSMKDVPTQLAKGLQQAAVLKRGNYRDILVLHPDIHERKSKTIFTSIETSVDNKGVTKEEFRLTIPLAADINNPKKAENILIGTSSIRRIAQWKNKYPDTIIENLRGNVNTRLRKLKESKWHGAIFAAAGLERINLRPENSVDLDWMLPAPAQGAIMIVCKEDDDAVKEKCMLLNDEKTALCTKIERDFLRTLMGGCSTPISALAEIKGQHLYFKCNLLSLDGKQKAEMSYSTTVTDTSDLGITAAHQILEEGGAEILEGIRNGK